MENLEEKRLRKRTTFEQCICPICGLTIRENELESHYRNELEKLTKIKKIINKSPQTSPNTSTKKDDLAAGSSKGDNNGENCWLTYQKIKQNRTRRSSKVKIRKRKIEDRACPICFKTNILNDDLQNHVELCLRRQENRSSDDESDENIDVGESYNWCGQTRIRATTLIEGSLSSTGIGTCISKSNENEDELVNIEDDDQTYGPSQYSERDIILLNKEDGRLRDLVASHSDLPSTSSSSSTAMEHETREENNQNIANSASSSPSPTNFLMDVDDTKPDIESNQQMIIDSLKAKIREYENVFRNRPKCLICLSHFFESPSVSVLCWHVHCEKCWLHTLGAKKLCPQCNTITAPSDLRRIYL